MNRVTPNLHRKPLMLWDGECDFCRRWIRRCNRYTGDAIDYCPYQTALADFPLIDETACQEAVQLIMPDGSVLPAAHAVLTALALSNKAVWLLNLYERSSLFQWLTESGYRAVAANRSRLPF